jgi:hypothetical protein
MKTLRQSTWLANGQDGGFQQGLLNVTMVCQFIIPVYFTTDGPCDLFTTEYLVVDDHGC